MPLLMRPVDPLPGSCSVETFGAPKYCPSPRYHFHTYPAHFRMDDWWRLDGIHQRTPRCRPTLSCRCPSSWVRSRVYSRCQLSDVAEGLRFLHSRNIVHGDLKGVRVQYKSCVTNVLTPVQPNVLVDTAGRARITDFGLATVTQNLDSIRSASEYQGHTARWTAPEILTEQGTYSKEADVFSFAMVMIEVRCEWAVYIELWFIVVPYHRRYLPVRFRSTIAYPQRLCWP